MRISFTPQAFAEYQERQIQDRKIAGKINRLINDIMRHPYDGLGKPEALKHDLQGYWSRRIDNSHRLVYFIRRRWWRCHNPMPRTLLNAVRHD